MLNNGETTQNKEASVKTRNVNAFRVKHSWIRKQLLESSFFTWILFTEIQNRKWDLLQLVTESSHIRNIAVLPWIGSTVQHSTESDRHKLVKGRRNPAELRREAASGNRCCDLRRDTESNRRRPGSGKPSRRACERVSMNRRIKFTFFRLTRDTGWAFRPSKFGPCWASASPWKV